MEIKLGDKVVVNDVTGMAHGFESGDVVTIIRYDNYDKTYKVERESDRGKYGWKEGLTQWIKRKQFTTRISERLEIGTICKVIGNSTESQFDTGELVELIEHDDKFETLNLFKNGPGEIGWLVDEDLELVKPESLQVGHKVMVNDVRGVFHSFDKGEIVELVKIEKDGVHQFRNEYGLEQYVETKQYELVYPDPLEIEYKIGDVVELVDVHIVDELLSGVSKGDIVVIYNVEDDVQVLNCIREDGKQCYMLPYQVRRVK